MWKQPRVFSRPHLCPEDGFKGAGPKEGISSRSAREWNDEQCGRLFYPSRVSEQLNKHKLSPPCWDALHFFTWLLSLAFFFPSSLPLPSTVLTFCRATYSWLGIPKKYHHRLFITDLLPAYATHARLGNLDELAAEVAISWNCFFRHCKLRQKKCHRAVSQSECICFCVG